MDKVDKLNDTVLDLVLNWKYVFYFVAGIFVLASILALAEGSNTAVLIIAWAIVVLAAVLMNIILREDRSSPKEEETESKWPDYS